MRVYKFLDARFAFKSLYERRLKISTFDDLNDPLDLLPYNVRKWKVRKKLNKLLRDLRSQYGILCFSRAWSNPVIWAHYADKHYGVCLGFDVPDGKLSPVTYVPDRLPSPGPILRVEHLDVLFTTKYKSWEYEEESRMVLELKRAEDGIHYHEFGSELDLKEVIAGSRCTMPRSGAERALGNLRENVHLTKARAAFGEFKIRAKDSGWE